MAEVPSERFFTIEVADAKFASGPMKGKRIENIGRYKSNTPVSAGRKAATRIYGEANVTSATFVLRETTRGSGNPVFVYTGEKKKLDKEVSYTRKKTLPDGSVVDETITKTHDNQVKAVRGDAEIRAVYKKLDLPFPSDVSTDQKVASKRRRLRGGGHPNLADTAYPLSSQGANATATMAMDRQYTMDGSDYKPSDVNVASRNMKGGSSQCCQTSPAHFSGNILGGNTDAIVSASIQNGVDQVASASSAATAASRERFLASL